MSNVADANPEVVSHLAALIKKYIAQGRSTPGPSLQNDVPVDVSKKKPRNEEAKE